MVVTSIFVWAIDIFSFEYPLEITLSDIDLICLLVSLNMIQLKIGSSIIANTFAVKIKVDSENESKSWLKLQTTRVNQS